MRGSVEGIPAAGALSDQTPKFRALKCAAPLKEGWRHKPRAASVQFRALKCAAPLKAPTAEKQGSWTGKFRALKCAAPLKHLFEARDLDGGENSAHSNARHDGIGFAFEHS